MQHNQSIVSFFLMPIVSSGGSLLAPVKLVIIAFVLYRCIRQILAIAVAIGIVTVAAQT